MEGRCSNCESYSKQQNNCRMTFWHSFVEMIHYDDVSVQDNTEEMTDRYLPAKCCNTVIGWQDFFFLFVCVLVVN